MLSDRERETLCEIERNLSDEDPKLAATLQTAKWPAARAHLRYAYTAVLVIGALLSVFALVLGHTTGALGCALVAGWAWGALQRKRLPEVRGSQVTD